MRAAALRSPNLHVMRTRNLLALVLTSVTATAAFPAARPALSATAPGTGAYGALHVFGLRGPPSTAASMKLDGALADLARHLSLLRPGHELSDLRALSPAARFTQLAAGTTPLVLIDAVTRGDPQQLKAALVAAGLQDPAVYLNDVGGWLPVSEISAVTARAEVTAIRAAMPRTHAGAVTSQGDYVMGSDVLRSTQSLDGTGIMVGVLSDSFDCYHTYAADGVAADGSDGYAPNGFTTDAEMDVTTGDLPADVDVLKEADCLGFESSNPAQLPETDEGRAMLQIVHDIAPGASLAFYTADDSEANFAQGIVALAQAGARVEADDVSYFDEPFFQDGIVAQAVNQVEAEGVAYFSAAGNEGRNSWESTAPDFVQPAAGSGSTEPLLNFDTSGATTATSLPITVAALIPGEYIALIVEWDQPYVTGAPESPGASSQIDLCVSGSDNDQLYDNNGNPLTSGCTGPNPLGMDPVQILVIGDPANDPSTASEHLNVTIGLAGGPVPGRIKLVLADDGAGSKIDSYSTESPTIQGHPGAAGAAAVGAAYYFTAPPCGVAAQLESYSSAGGDPILFDESGTRLATPVVRQKPDFVGPDGVNNTFLGWQLTPDSTPPIPVTTLVQCQDSQGGQGYYPTFFGTSAATPHAAGIAALLLQAYPSATPEQVYAAMRSSAVPMGTAPSYNSGYGFIQAGAALKALASSLSSSGTSASSSSSSTPGAAAAQTATGTGGGGSLGLITLLLLGGLIPVARRLKPPQDGGEVAPDACGPYDA